MVWDKADWEELIPEEPRIENFVIPIVMKVLYYNDIRDADDDLDT